MLVDGSKAYRRPNSKQYEENYDKIFRNKKKKKNTLINIYVIMLTFIAIVAVLALYYNIIKSFSFFLA